MTRANIAHSESKNNNPDKNGVSEAGTLFDISPAIIPDNERVIKNYWGKKVAHPEALVTFKGGNIPVLRGGGKLVIKSLPKAGKTSADEAIIAYLLNPKSPTMGCTARLYGRTKILFIDTEQSEFESQESYNRIMRRAGWVYDPKHPDPPEEEKRLIHLNYKRLLPDEMLVELIATCEKNPEIGLVVFDVVTDMADDAVMEMKDAIKVLRFLNSLNEGIGIICNIHVNPGENITALSRGHLGHELERKCSACIYMKKLKNNVIEMSVVLGRGTPESEKVYCKWDDSLMMYVEFDYTPPVKIDIKDKYEDEVKALFIEDIELKTAELKNRFLKLRPGTGKNNFKKYLGTYQKQGLIQSVTKGLWKIKCIN